MLSSELREVGAWFVAGADPMPDRDGWAEYLNQTAYRIRQLQSAIGEARRLYGTMRMASSLNEELNNTRKVFVNIYGQTIGAECAHTVSRSELQEFVKEAERIGERILEMARLAMMSEPQTVTEILNEGDGDED